MRCTQRKAPKTPGEKGGLPGGGGNKAETTGSLSLTRDRLSSTLGTEIEMQRAEGCAQSLQRGQKQEAVGTQEPELSCEMPLTEDYETVSIDGNYKKNQIYRTGALIGCPK